jgi:hypothetical protein
MAIEKAETHPVPATVIDMMTGNSTPEGAKTEKGVVVTKTETETEDDEE